MRGGIELSRRSFETPASAWRRIGIGRDGEALTPPVPERPRVLDMPPALPPLLCGGNAKRSRRVKDAPRIAYCLLPLACCLLLVGCTSISVAPSCPAELRVGDAGMIMANERDPGAIPRYLWEVFPVEAGTFANSSAPDTTFQPRQEGQARLRLTASDGLFQVMADCIVQVRGVAGVAVALDVEPATPMVEEVVTLFCDSIGETEAVTRTITFEDGPEIIMLTVTEEGVARFEARRAGEYVFECIGENAAGTRSEPMTLTVMVNPSTPDNENMNGNANENGNVNGNDNEEGNTNANANANRNDNEGNTNSNDNA